MRVVHCCLANFYADGYGYQENVLPRMHKLQGHDVLILASTETLIERKLGYVAPSRYLNDDQIPVHRLPYARWLPHKIMTKLRCYRGLYDELESFKPDVIFLHGTQFMDIRKVSRYATNHQNVTVFADGHADFNNSARGLVSKYVLHRFLYRLCTSWIVPYVRRFYGTLPARIDFMKTMYAIPPEKIELLTMGADDQLAARVRKAHVRQAVRRKFGIDETDFLIVTGGKIDSRRREVLNLMRAVLEIGRPDVKLLVFGSVSRELEDEFNRLCDGSSVKMAGWMNEAQTYECLGAADLAVFPGLHSVLWEQAVGLGIPCLFRRIRGFSHIDLGGNCRFLAECTTEEMKAEILNCIDSHSHMKRVASENAYKFSFADIARRAIM